MSIFKTLLKLMESEYTDFYETAFKRQFILDSLVDSALLQDDNSFMVLNIALPSQDIKYIYNRIMCLEDIFGKRQKREGR